MPAGSALDMLRQLQQQLGSGQIARGATSSLDSAGLGALRPRQFYSTPFDEQALRMQLMQRILGGFGAQLPQSGFAGFDPFTGSFRSGREGLGGFTGQDIPGLISRETIGDTTSMPSGDGFPKTGVLGRRDIGGMQSRSTSGLAPDIAGDITRFDLGLIGSATGGGFSADGATPDIFTTGGMTTGQMPVEGFGFGLPDMPRGGLDAIDRQIPLDPRIQAQLPVGARPTGVQYSDSGRTGIRFEAPFEQMTNPGAAGFQQAPDGSFVTAPSAAPGLPELDANTRQSLNAMTQSQLGQLDIDFQQQRQGLINDLFSKGMQGSSVGGDLGGKLLFGRGQLMNEVLGQAAEREMAIRQQLFAAQQAKDATRPTFGGGGGGGIRSMQGVAGDMSASPGSFDALSFDQKMALADLGLRQEQTRGQLGLGGRELDIRQLLGQGELGLGRSGQEQAMLQFLMGQGLERQRLAGGLASSERGRMTDFTSGREQLFGSIGQQQAQIEAQRRSFMSQLLGGLAGGALSLGSAALTGGIPLGSIFGGGGAGHSLGGMFSGG